MSARGVRWVMSVGLALLSALWLSVGCAGQQEGGSQKEEQEEFVVGEFVGEIPDADAFIALIAEEPQQGEDTREVRIYLCDGKQLNEWFAGMVGGDNLQLAFGNGGHLYVSFARELTVGTIMLSNDESYDFQVPQAAGVEGFYPVSVPSEGPVSGSSWSGAQLEGRRIDGEIAGTVTSPDGEVVDFEASVPTIEEGDNRWITLIEDGRFRIKGAERGAASTGSIDPTTHLRNPGFIDL